MFEYIYTFVTLLLISGALGNAMVIPLAGAIGSLAIMLALTVKYFIGKSGLGALVKPEELLKKKLASGAGGEAAAAQAQKAAQTAKAAEAAKTAAKAAKAGTIWGLIIDYLTAPMNQFEKIALVFGWVLLPVAASIPFAILLGLTNCICRGLGFDWCQLAPIQAVMNLFD